MVAIASKRSRYSATIPHWPKTRSSFGNKGAAREQLALNSRHLRVNDPKVQLTTRAAISVMRKNIFPALLLLLLPSLASVASACTCGGQAPCEAYAGASVVFVGVVTKTGFKTIPLSLPEFATPTTPTSGDVTSAQFKVEESFLGVRGAQIEISGQGTNCDYEFKAGDRYLVFAYKNSKTGTFHTNICSGTGPLAENNEGLAYLRSVVKQAPGATLFGEVARETYGPDGIGGEPIAKAEVILINGKDQFRGLSDGSGKFEVRGIKPGRYRVHTNPATNHSRIDPMAEEPRKEWELDIPAHGCVQTWFVARPGGEISGRVGDESGVVGGDIYPQILFADEKVTDTSYRSQNLTEGKTFKFSFLPPGRYYLGFNLRGGPSIETPYPEFYYPGVEDRSKAEVITLAEGQQITEIYLRRPLRLAERMIEGVAVWPDEKPYVENCGISLTNPRTGYREGNCVSTDAEGKFKIKAVEGQTYHLAATLVGPGRGLISSKPLVLKVEKDNSPFKLVVEKP